MPWIRLWARESYAECANPSDVIDFDYDRFMFAEKIPSEAAMNEAAREYMPSWYGDNGRPVKCGGEIYENLPENVREHLFKGFESQRLHAEINLQRLKIDSSVE